MVWMFASVSRIVLMQFRVGLHFLQVLAVVERRGDDLAGIGDGA